MNPGLQELVAFHLTGRRQGNGLEPIDPAQLRPALLVAYRDLSRLRYDFPLVLVNHPPDARSSVQTLSGITNDIVRTIAQGDDGDRLAQHVMRLERSIRGAVASGATGTLTTLWDEVASQLLAHDDELLGESLQRARAALSVDGEVVDCGKATPAQVLQHSWSFVQRVKEDQMRDRIDRLSLALADILRADLAHSAAGRSADRLRAAVGAGDTELFDFNAMERLLGPSSPASVLPASRRRRIEHLRSVLEAQRFFAAPSGASAAADEAPPYSFVFRDCGSALAAYRERLPQALDVAKALAMAELEIETAYSEATHDALFADFGADGLDSDTMAMFPDYLVCLDAAQLRGTERDDLLEILAAGLPMKVLLQSDDILEESGIAGDAHLSFAPHTRSLTNMVMGLNDVFVLQVSGSHLYQSRERILAGLTSSRPSLFSVFSGASQAMGDLPPYLIAAAAMESRAFPAFSYDPDAGDTWAERFQLALNPQLERNWPVQSFTYEDEERQRIDTTIAFTPVDFIACDHRFGKHFVRTPRASLNGSLVSPDEYLSDQARHAPATVPTILMVDMDNKLQTVVVDDKLIRAARRCQDAWHSLQELGGIHNSHAERLLARERQAWETAERHAAVSPQPPVLASATADVAESVAPVALAAPSELEPAPAASDDPYIESARCTSCNECIQINGKMFAYNENRQAYIADPNAGTFRQLVEAAESCQVAIIHPGKPRNPNEAGLDELIARAEAFQ